VPPAFLPFAVCRLPHKTHTMPNKLEVIGFNIASCIVAQQNGADRIELCHNPADGGTTPSFGFIAAARNALQVDLYPIIRPRGGDFLYSNSEFEIMRADLVKCRELGCDGVVIGMLNPDGSVDKKRSAILVELAFPMGVTFHRAFDRVADPFVAMEDIIDIGCERILTSGLRPTAIEGIALLKELVKEADERIIIMPGSGIRSSTIEEIARDSGACEFHTSARIDTRGGMTYVNPQMREELTDVQCDGDEVRRIAELLGKTCKVF
jgi:copper homeostasis protein